MAGRYGLWESHNITWTMSGSIANVELAYSTNGGTTYSNVITASTPAANLSYPWTIPNAIGTQLRVQITDAIDPTVTGASSANFQIKGSLTLTSPVGGEIWIVGQSQNITWGSTGSITNANWHILRMAGVPILILLFPQLTWQPEHTPGQWQMPSAARCACKLPDLIDPTVTSASPANFQIKGSLTITAPIGGETWIVASSDNITWNRSGSIANVQINYSTDGGGSYPNLIVSSTSAANLSYAWSIPDAIGTQVRVKITNVLDSTVFSASPGNFKIAGSFIVTAPVGGEVWIVGTNQNITWTMTGSMANAAIQYSTDGGVTFPNIITSSIPATLYSYTWTIPNNITSTDRVMVSDAADSTVFGTSPANFKIAGSFTIVAPNGGEKWAINTTQAVTWTMTGTMSNAELKYSTDGGSTYPNVIIATTPAANLNYSWTIPNNPASTARVEIIDVADSTVFATSAGNFKMMGSFSISSPNGGEVWVVGQTHNIIWTTVGSISNVNLAYSIDGGSTYPNSIAQNVSNTGSYSWTIPNAIGTTLRVKVTDAIDSDATTASAGNFKIEGSIAVTAPTSASAWIVGTTQNITWTIVGSIANVTINYSTDGGITYPTGNLIAASVSASSGTYAWTIPNAISTTVVVQVANVSDGTVYSVSPDFIIRGAFQVIAPNGGEKWAVGTVQTISWNTSGTIVNVELVYSTDGGVTFPSGHVIIASTSNLGSYNWTIPNNISSTCIMRVSNPADPGTFGVSAANFKIMGGFIISAPNGGEIWVVGSNHNITWTSAGTVANVALAYSSDGGNTYPNVIASTTPNNNSYAWTVPDAISATLRMRVSDATDSDASSVSAANFKIRGGFTLNSPSGGEAWVVNSVHNITWTSYGTMPNVNIDYSTDGGNTYPNVISASTSNTGTYAWTIPDAIINTARVSVSSVNDSTSIGISNSNFKIEGSLTITAPNGGENWTIGSIQSITWNRVGSIPFVNLGFSTNGGGIYAPIVVSTSNTGSYAWTIPDAASTMALVQISDTADATVSSTSAADFNIQVGFTMISPNGGENWLVGSGQTIAWSTEGTVPYVELAYSLDGGSTFPNVVTTSTPNTGTYSWTVPNSVSGTVRMKVSETTNVNAFGISSGNFRIRASFTLTSPNGGETWLVGNSYNITWTDVGTMPGVELKYSRDNFLTDKQVITTSAPETGSYSWTIPDAISNTVMVRVGDPNDIGAYSDSAAYFRIIARFTLTAPNGGEQWPVNTTQNITWTSAGTVSQVEIAYSTNGGATYPNIIAATGNTGTYAWIVPDTITTAFKVEVSDLADATSYGVSAANAQIIASFVVGSPNGGEIWRVGTTDNITWTTVGTVTNVSLAYSTDGGTTYPYAIAASAPNTGTYVWVIPDSISTTVRVRVMSAIAPYAFGTSAANFKIRWFFYNHSS